MSLRRFNAHSNECGKPIEYLERGWLYEKQTISRNRSLTDQLNNSGSLMDSHVRIILVEHQMECLASTHACE